MPVDLDPRTKALLAMLADAQAATCELAEQGGFQLDDGGMQSGPQHPRSRRVE